MPRDMAIGTMIGVHRQGHGVIGFLSVMTPDGENYTAHNPKYCLNTEYLINGVLFHINMAKTFLEENGEDS